MLHARLQGSVLPATDQCCSSLSTSTQQGQRCPWGQLEWEKSQEGCRGGCRANPGTIRHPGETTGRVYHLLWVAGAWKGWYCVLLTGSKTSVIYRALGDAQKRGATQA